MFSSKPRKVSLTLFCYLALVLAIASVAQADSVHQPAVARDHVNLNRMMRKRIPQGLLLTGTNGAAQEPPTFSDSSSAAAASSTAAASSAAASQSSASVSASSSASAQSSSSSVPASSSSQSSSAPASSSSAASSSSSVVESSSAVQSSSSVAAEPTPAPAQQSAVDDSQSSSKQTSTKTVNVVMSTVTADQPSDTAGASAVGAAANNTSVSKTAITVLAVIAGSVAAIAIGWTIIRKWKFKPSSSFEDRMTPIDWQPDGSGAGGAADDGIPGVRRNASTASHGSFHSAGHDDYPRGFSDHGHGTSSLQPIPDHDFTAGSSLAPVGGYADLARGPSPGPQMAQLNRGPSMNNGYGGYEGGYGAPRY